jgi:DNA invertase Pin-like site-specific DNA recombinase
MNYIAYYRVSTAGQGKSGLGLEAQQAAVCKWIKDGNLLASYTDIESGKRHQNRPQLLAALARCKEEEATLVIAKLDRLSRNLYFISGLMESGVDFIACDMDKANKFTLHIFAALAEQEREAISTRTVSALKAAKARGTELGNPEWRQSIAKARAARGPHEEDAKTVALIVTLRGMGNSYPAIARQLNAMPLQTVYGKKWYPATVRKQIVYATSRNESTLRRTA